MRSIPTLLAIAAATPALGADFFTQAAVSAVTIYPSGAEQVLSATLDLEPGTHRIFMPYKSTGGMEALPRIRTSPGVAIGEMGFRRGMSVEREALFTDAQAAAWQILEEKRDDVTAKRDALDEALTKVKALEARLAFLRKVAPGRNMDAPMLLSLATTLHDEIAAAETELIAARAAARPATEALKDAELAEKAAKRGFESLSPPGDVVDMLSVEVSVAQAGPVTLELTELTSKAWWTVDYDINLDRDTNTISIDRKLIVTQETGMLWDEVALTLSTTRPGDVSLPSAVTPDLAYIHPPIAYAENDRDMMAGSPDTAKSQMAMAAPEMMTAEVLIEGLSVSYVYPDPVTIASAEAAELALDTLSFAAEPGIIAAPRHDETAFIVATLTNDTPEPILPGPANYLRDGKLVGRYNVELIPPGGEAELGFGAMESIRLDTHFERNAEGDTGLIRRSNTREQIITFTVENLTNEAQEVRALFPVTFSEQEDLKVNVTATPRPDETDIDRLRGVSAWNLSVAPKETAEVTLKVRFDWPDGQELEWYP